MGEHSWARVIAGASPPPVPPPVTPQPGCPHGPAPAQDVARRMVGKVLIRKIGRTAQPSKIQAAVQLFDGASQLAGRVLEDLSRRRSARSWPLTSRGILTGPAVPASRDGGGSRAAPGRDQNGRRPRRGSPGATPQGCRPRCGSRQRLRWPGRTHPLLPRPRSSGGRDAAPFWAKGLGRHTSTQSRVGCSRLAPTPEGISAVSPS